MAKWADGYIAMLKEGHSVCFRPKGGSMTGIIESGDLVEVEPLRDSPVYVNDVVLCEVRGRQLVHLVRWIRRGKDDVFSYGIGNNRGGFNGHVGRERIYGRVTEVNGAPLRR